MITFSTEHGNKVFFADVYKNDNSTSVATKQYLPYSQHIAYPSANNYALYYTNIVTGEEQIHTLQVEEDIPNRGIFFKLNINTETIHTFEEGTYSYKISAYKSQFQPIIELDSGLLHIYNNDTFTDKYINPSVTTIPVVKVYKPS